LLGAPERKEKKHKSCRFCEWLQQWNTWKKGKGKAKCIEKTDNDDFVAVFDQFPRVDGEILIISRRTYDDA